jgi:hypothetical protein
MSCRFHGDGSTAGGKMDAWISCPKEQSRPHETRMTETDATASAPSHNLRAQPTTSTSVHHRNKASRTAGPKIMNSKKHMCVA